MNPTIEDQLKEFGEAFVLAYPNGRGVSGARAACYNAARSIGLVTEKYGFTRIHTHIVRVDYDKEGNRLSTEEQYGYVYAHISDVSCDYCRPTALYERPRTLQEVKNGHNN